MNGCAPPLFSYLQALSATLETGLPNTSRRREKQDDALSCILGIGGPQTIAETQKGVIPYLLGKSRDDEQHSYRPHLLRRLGDLPNTVIYLFLAGSRIGKTQLRGGRKDWQIPTLHRAW